MDRPRLNEQRIIVYIALLVSLVLFGYLAVNMWSNSETASASASTPTRRVNMPYLGAGPPVEFFEPAVFWFGGVTPTINNADVRMWYYDTYMKLTVHIIDRRLWYDTTPLEASLEEWDAVTIYLSRDGNTGQSPTSNSYRLVSQLHRWEAAADYQTTYKGNGMTWDALPFSFTAETIYRGNGGVNKDSNNKGWQLTAVIPFDSLGLSGPPPIGTTWGLAFAVHDRDDASGTPIPDQIWPEQMEPNKPATWGQLHFGRAMYNPPAAAPAGSTTIRHGLDEATMVDGHVGGHTICGNNLEDHYTAWGEANYAGYPQINIQNQWDISDYPCFSKYFVTFPLDLLPPGKTIIAATLQMKLFGGSWNPKGPTPDSYIQVLTVGEDWNEATLNWNNAPLAIENTSGTWVKPHWLSPSPDIYWDVSKPVAKAYQSEQPVRLALYSADGERHTGKYFWSSDSGVQKTAQRPTLQVIWGDRCDSPDVDCFFMNLPAILK